MLAPTRYSMYVAPPKYSTVALERPMSAIVFHSGCFSGDHRMTCGLTSIGAMTWSVGWSFEFWTASSVATTPSVIDGSRYICADTCWKPIAGPPDRTSSLIPVSRSEAISSPVTRFFSESTAGAAPRRRYSPACSACGNQFIWTTTVDGHTLSRSSLLPLAARGTTVTVWGELPPLPHAVRRTRAATSANRAITDRTARSSACIPRLYWPVDGRSGAGRSEQALWRRHPGAGGRRPGRCRGRVRGRRGPVRQRQDDPAPPGRRPGAGDGRRRARGRRARRLGVP